MNTSAMPSAEAFSSAGDDMHRWMAELFPICRSITGNGVRETLKQIGKRIPLTVHEVPSGTQVFDWKVPLEWNIRDAYIKKLRGERVVDFQANIWLEAWGLTRAMGVILIAFAAFVVTVPVMHWLDRGVVAAAAVTDDAIRYCPQLQQEAQRRGRRGGPLRAVWERVHRYRYPLT